MTFLESFWNFWIELFSGEGSQKRSGGGAH